MDHRFITLIILSILIFIWVKVIIAITKSNPHPFKKKHIKFFFFNNYTLTQKTGGFQMEKSVQAKAGLQIFGHIDPKDDAGNEVPIADGSEVFSSSDETIMTVVSNPKNPKYFIGTLTGSVGDVKVQVSLNADPNAADAPDVITDFATLHVTPDLATTANLEFDDTDDAPDTTATASTSGQ